MDGVREEAAVFRRMYKSSCQNDSTHFIKKVLHTHRNTFENTTDGKKDKSRINTQINLLSTYIQLKVKIDILFCSVVSNNI